LLFFIPPFYEPNLTPQASIYVFLSRAADAIKLGRGTLLLTTVVALWERLARPARIDARRSWLAPVLFRESFELYLAFYGQLLRGAVWVPCLSRSPMRFHCGGQHAS